MRNVIVPFHEAYSKQIRQEVVYNKVAELIYHEQQNHMYLQSHGYVRLLDKLKRYISTSTRCTNKRTTNQKVI